MLATAVLVPSYDSRWAGLADILGTFDDLTILETATTPEAALAAAAHWQPTVIFLATVVGGSPAGALVAQLRAASPASRFIMLGAGFTPGALWECVSAGVRVAVEWPFATEDILRACLNVVLAGGVLTIPDTAMVERRRQPRDRAVVWKPGERSVYKLREQGCKLAEIARRENMSLAMVNRYMASIRAKSAARSDIALGLMAVDLGLSA
jgi:DNA-binding NarL/FixJ family response regulator